MNNQKIHKTTFLTFLFAATGKKIEFVKIGTRFDKKHFHHWFFTFIIGTSLLQRLQFNAFYSYIDFKGKTIGTNALEKWQKLFFLFVRLFEKDIYLSFCICYWFIDGYNHFIIKFISTWTSIMIYALWRDWREL